MPYEVEQKFAVVDFAIAEQRLVALGARFGERLLQIDRYFAHPARDFYQTDEALRIRRVGASNFVTYKGPKLDTATKTRREIELPLAGGAENLARYTELLTALGFTEVAEVKKERRPAELHWQGRIVEAALDDVAGVGTFVELETQAEAEELDVARAAIASLGAELGLVQSERRSYLEMLLSSVGENRQA